MINKNRREISWRCNFIRIIWWVHPSYKGILRLINKYTKAQEELQDLKLKIMITFINIQYLQTQYQRIQRQVLKRLTPHLYLSSNQLQCFHHPQRRHIKRTLRFRFLKSIHQMYFMNNKIAFHRRNQYLHLINVQSLLIFSRQMKTKMMINRIMTISRHFSRTKLIKMNQN